MCSPFFSFQSIRRSFVSLPPRKHPALHTAPPSHHGDCSAQAISAGQYGKLEERSVAASSSYRQQMQSGKAATKHTPRDHERDALEMQSSTQQRTNTPAIEHNVFGPSRVFYSVPPSAAGHPTADNCPRAEAHAFHGLGPVARLSALAAGLGEKNHLQSEPV